MTFSNPLYSRVTKYFFDTLVVNINDAFVNACNEQYVNEQNKEMKKSMDDSKTVRDYLDSGNMDQIEKQLKTPRKPVSKEFKHLNKQKENSDFEFKFDHRLNNRRKVQSKPNFDSGSNENDQRKVQRLARSKGIIRDLFRDNTLSSRDRDKVNQKMQDKEFLNDIYILDQALGGSPDYKKKIAKHIRKSIE